MVQYAGGKARIGKKIHDCIMAYEKEKTGYNKLPYFEPFVGMGGVMRHFAEDLRENITICDREECITSFWKEVKEGWKPHEVSKEEYINVKNSNVYNALYAFCCYGCSYFGSKWTHYYEHCMKSSLKRVMKFNYVKILKNTTVLDHKSYIDHEPVGNICYCDPPYTNSSFDKRRGNLLDFDTDLFWETMRRWSENNIVIISEREAPDDFMEILSFERVNTFNKKTIAEKLFVKLIAQG